MGGDSAYLAWFKAHHTAKFYETAINHYHSKGKKDKIEALVKEAIKFYGYKLAEYKFGDDNRKCTVDEKSHTIHPNLSSIKGFGENVATELYRLGKETFVDFKAVIEAITASCINRTVFDKLIKIGYFSDFGEIKYLLEVVRLYKLVNNRKEISKAKAEEEGIPCELLRIFGHETNKKFTRIDSEGLYAELISHIPHNEISLTKLYSYQNEILGMVSTIIPTAKKHLYFAVSSVIRDKVVILKLFEIQSGIILDAKLWVSQYNIIPIYANKVVYVSNMVRTNKQEPTGRIIHETGKKEYKIVPDKYEYWVKKYVVQYEEDNIWTTLS